jgi:hypothetical protein
MNTLTQVIDELRAGAPLAVALGNFLDGFYRAPDAGLLADEPPLLGGEHGAPVDAYLAGVAEHLARLYAMAVPAWVFSGPRYLRRPVFGLESAALRATLLLESPPAFRTRNVFVTANALDRASRRRVA